MDWSASFLGVSSQKYRLWYSAHRLITHVEALLPLLSVSLKNSSSSSSRRFSFLMSSPASVPAAVFFSPQGGIKSNFPELPLLSRPPTHSHTPSAGFSGASSWSRWSCSRTALAAGWWAPARRGSATGDRSGSPSGWTSAPPAAPAAPGDATGGGSAGLSPVLYGKTWGTKDDRRKTFIVWSL